MATCVFEDGGSPSLIRPAEGVGREEVCGSHWEITSTANLEENFVNHPAAAVTSIHVSPVQLFSNFICRVSLVNC